VIYNWSERAGYTGSSSDPREFISMDWVGNYIVAGPATPTSSSAVPQFSVLRNSTANIYQSNNLSDLNHDAVRDGTDLGWGGFLVQGAAGTGTLAAGVLTNCRARQFPLRRFR